MKKIILTLTLSLFLVGGGLFLPVEEGHARGERGERAERRELIRQEQLARELRVDDAADTGEDRIYDLAEFGAVLVS